MPPLSNKATAILERMEPNRSYDAAEIRAFAPDASVESLREVMHELWVNRHVERLGFSGWRRNPPSAQASVGAGDPALRGSGGYEPRPAQTKAVGLDDLFDHDAFSGFFK